MLWLAELAAEGLDWSYTRFQAKYLRWIQKNNKKSEKSYQFKSWSQVVNDYVCTENVFLNYDVICIECRNVYHVFILIGADVLSELSVCS